MYLQLVFALNLWYYPPHSDDEEIVELYLDQLTPRMEDIVLNEVIWPYSATSFFLDQHYLTIGINYPKSKLGELSSYLDGIMVEGNAPDLWMESDLSLPEYPNAEFVPTLVEVYLGF